MKIVLWILAGLAVLILVGALALVLRGRAAQRADSELHRGLARTLELTSPAFENEWPMPAALSCEGDGGSPPLAWDSVPEGARSFALIVVDLDIPSSSAQLLEFVHWVVYDLPAETRSLEAQATSEQLSQLGAVAGQNGYGGRSYVNPCPVSGTHRYLYRLYALDVGALQPERGSKAGVLAAMDGHVLAYGELLGTYQCKTYSFWSAMRQNVGGAQGE